MKVVEFYICLLLAVVTVLLAVLVFTTGRSVEKLQISINTRQQTSMRNRRRSTKGSLSQQVGVNLLRESAQVAVGNARMRELLQRNGITVTVNPPAAPTTQPASSPAPAASKK